MKKDYLYGSFFLALGVLVPQLFHMTGVAGPVFLPMHFPVFLAGVLVSPKIGLLVGITSPIFSNILTGMPPVSPPVMQMMVFELAAYGFVSGAVYRQFKKNIYISLISGMIAGRLCLGLAAYIGMKMFGFNINPVLYVKGAVITGVPGIILQLLVIPVLVLLVEKGVSHARSANSN
jgi:niacin transporter